MSLRTVIRSFLTEAEDDDFDDLIDSEFQDQQLTRDEICRYLARTGENNDADLDIYDVLLNGYVGYRDWKDEGILDYFWHLVGIFAMDIERHFEQPMQFTDGKIVVPMEIYMEIKEALGEI